MEKNEAPEINTKVKYKGHRNNFLIFFTLGLISLLVGISDLSGYMSIAWFGVSIWFFGLSSYSGYKYFKLKE